MVSDWHSALVFVAIALLAVTRLEHLWVIQMQAQLLDWFAGPIGGIRQQLSSLRKFRQKVDYVLSDNDGALDRLRAENKDLIQ